MKFNKLKNSLKQNKAYILVGIPGSGKSWIANQLKDKYNYVSHDENSKNYIERILKASEESSKPLLLETPFSLSSLVGSLQAQGIKCVPVFIIDDPELFKKQYEKREGKKIPKGHLTRLETYKQRAKELKAKTGTANEVLNYLKGLV